jgi:hypothetical protein
MNAHTVGDDGEQKIRFSDYLIADISNRARFRQ